jgi:hypothetical protein
MRRCASYHHQICDYRGLLAAELQCKKLDFDLISYEPSDKRGVTPSRGLKCVSACPATSPLLTMLNAHIVHGSIQPEGIVYLFRDKEFCPTQS